MLVGVTLRNMGPESTRTMMADCVRVAEDREIESVWITDHVAIPPDDAQGSGGRYVDPFATLSWFAGLTSKIKLGAGVIVLPYRPPLLLARQVAAVQELSAGRLLLGVGIGWMAAEFRAVGADLRNRARDSDAALEFLNRCFANDVVEANGQPFLFKPRPPRPPVLVGGRPPHALERAARYGDGWLPMGLEPADVGPMRVRFTNEIRLQQYSLAGPHELAPVQPQRADSAAHRIAHYRRLVVGRLTNNGDAAGGTFFGGNHCGNTLTQLLLLIKETRQ